LHYHHTSTGHIPFREWLRSIRDPHTVARIDARLARVRQGNLGDAKKLGGGILELRLAFGPGYRNYFAVAGDYSLILLLGGSRVTQHRDIRRAKAYYADYHQRTISAGRELP
jgi:putative addiction module killer protein